MAGLARMQTIDAAPASRAQALMAQAKAEAREQVRQLEAALAHAVRLAEEVSGGGEAYPAGVRDVCARLSLEVVARSQQIAAIARAH